VVKRINEVNSKKSKPVSKLNTMPDHTGEYLLPLKTDSRARFFLMFIFIGLLVALQLGWNYARGTALERLFVNEMTVKPSAWMIAHLTPDIPIQAIGSHLSAPGGGINILNGCDGMEVVLLLVAAMLIAPISIQHRFLGILLGSSIIILCNQARILALFYTYRTDKIIFNLLHGIVAPTFLILVAALFYMLWLGKFSAR
jgi:exosortase family protein XrtM